MKIFSETTGREYEAEDAVFYRNVVQSAWLLNKPNVVLLDVFADSCGKLVMVFKKEDHKRYLQEWIERSNRFESK